MHGHRSSASCVIVEGSGSMHDLENGSRKVAQFTPVVIHQSVTDANRRGTGLQVSLLPAPKPAKQVPLEPSAKDLLRTSSFAERFQGALSMFMSHHREHLYLDGQGSDKIMLSTLIVLGLLLNFCLCIWCWTRPGQASSASSASITDQPSIASQASSLIGQAAPDVSVALGHRRQRFRNWLKSWIDDCDPTYDEAAGGDRVTSEDRLASILGSTNKAAKRSTHI